MSRAIVTLFVIASVALIGRAATHEQPTGQIIPESRALRRIPRYTLSTTATNGQYKLVGVVPGSYYVFAAPARRDHAYFAMDFADLHRRRATHVDISAGAPIVVDLRPLRASEI
jgi:sarcosine oxidase gamma subunit